jgi:hypothetical protein
MIAHDTRRFPLGKSGRFDLPLPSCAYVVTRLRRNPMRLACALVVVGVALSGCASYNRLASYEVSNAYRVEEVTTEAGTFKVRRHPHEQTFWVQPPFKVTGKAALVSDVTLGTQGAAASYGNRPAVMVAASAYAEGMGCKAVDLVQVSSFAWEATFVCP